MKVYLAFFAWMGNAWKNQLCSNVTPSSLLLALPGLPARWAKLGPGCNVRQQAICQSCSIAPALLDHGCSMVPGGVEASQLHQIIKEGSAAPGELLMCFLSDHGVCSNFWWTSCSSLHVACERCRVKLRGGDWAVRCAPSIEHYSPDSLSPCSHDHVLHYSHGELSP